ncbi:type II inositol 3,4-bisphosphate 4-phosphatase-like [Osmerus eperlanus]|uniref:type II inositol 3,4-bisphosphate 4-phosphatase-like n=1 Tax=Osmerus eperlanus TaxID=29151 RepID=UPI002E1602BB
MVCVWCVWGCAGVWYEVITVGAAADHSQGFKHGGLQRLLSARSVGVSSEQSSRARELLGSVAQLRPLLCGQAEELLQASLELCSSLLLRALDRLAATTGQFVHVLKDDLVRSSLLALHTTSPAPTQTWSTTRRDCMWANVAKSLNCIVAMVDRLQERDHTPQEVTSEGSTDNTKNTGWRDQLLPLVVTLQDCVGEAEAWARPAVTAFLLQGEHRCCPGAPITQRRDAVFSQALSALVCGVCLRVYSGLQDQLFLQQLHLQGVLVQYEGLLSTYGDEQGILEDMEVGVMDLNRVSFSLSLATSDLPCSMQPCLSSPRGDDIVVQVPLPPDAFAALPWELRDGQLVRVHPVFFNIGINQQQSLAERFGDSSVQDRINMRSFELLKVYYNTLKKTLPSVCGVEVEQVEEVLVSLQVSLQSKRRKNTDVLWLAAQVCRALRGVRLTSCKSAKDRTSMSVTLEQVRVLSQQHNLSPQHFPHALDCMRREGCRMENVQKNICSRKYAFNSVQLLTFPRLYRPPEGTYGRAAS